MVDTKTWVVILEHTGNLFCQFIFFVLFKMVPPLVLGPRWTTRLTPPYRQASLLVKIKNPVLYSNKPEFKLVITLCFILTCIHATSIHDHCVTFNFTFHIQDCPMTSVEIWIILQKTHSFFYCINCCATLFKTNRKTKEV